jgi:hypothetical protein
VDLVAAADVIPADARDEARAARKILAASKNPIDEQRKAATADIPKPTFGEMADELATRR